jgi:TolB-like protein
MPYAWPLEKTARSEAEHQMSLFSELKRRNVFRVAIAYLITAWLLIQLADILIPMLTLPEWVARFILLLLVILFIPTLIAAWALELTPDGLKLEKDVDRSASITPTTGKKLNGITIGLLALAVVVLLVDKFYLSAGSSAIDDNQLTAVTKVEKSIAVLPFADLSQGQDQEWFADGLAEEILNSLARTPDLLVASRTSAFAYKGSDKDLRVIATELGVAHILEGSVRRAGEQLRVTAQLIRASDGFHLWSENYDRDAAEVIQVQEDLAVKIASALETTMDPEALKDMLSVGTQSVEAYQLYLQGKAIQTDVYATGEYENLQTAYDKYEQAREIDPEFSIAHEQAAEFWESQSQPTVSGSGLTDASAAEIRDMYLQRIDRAIATSKNPVDERLLEAKKASYELRLRRALALYESHIEARPHDIVGWNAFSNVAISLGDEDAHRMALEHLKEAGLTRLDAAQLYVGDAYRLFDASDAADYGLQAIKRWPEDNNLLYQTHRTLMWAKRPDEAALLAQQINDLYGFDEMVVARQACMEGRTEDVLNVLAGLREGDNRRRNLIWLILLLLGEKEAAAEELKQYESAETPQTIASWLVYHKFDPSPYPVLMEILEREGVQRPPVAEMPYTCPAK